MPLFQEAHGAVPSIYEWVLWAILASPLVGWALIVAYLRKTPQIAGYAAIASIGVSLVLSTLVLFNVMDADGGVAVHSHEWFTAGPLEVRLGVRVDGLTAVMLMVVTVVSFLVQVYSTGYMAGDPGYGRYFAHMCLFVFSMLGLVLADNLFQIFIFWELVGLCSYLLIGFWFHRPSAAAAAKKAFITTRIGDLGLLAALLLIWTRHGDFDVASIQEWAHASGTEGWVVTLFALGVFAGAVGKSAQFPLHVWLPDAMEGPTPVSALIHAATMVAAGVYLVARFFPVFEASEDAQTVVAWIGAATAFIAATIAIVQTDFKRVMAYSTVSQLGLMMLSLGALGYVAAIFHLFTHAFFKALLFLCSGSVNHATNTFDMRLMGGLRSHMPITFWTFVIGSLSLAGIFPLAGFWSKDELLLDAWNHDKVLWAVGTTVAFMTAFYMFRAVFMTFFGEYKGGGEPEHAPPPPPTPARGARGRRAAPAPATHDAGHGHSSLHESPRAMALPLLILAVPSIAIGWVNLDGGFGHWVEGALPEHMRHFEVHFELIVLATSLGAALAGIGLAAAMYFFGAISPARVRGLFGPLPGIIENKYYMDRIAGDGIVRGALNGGLGRAWQLFDTYVVDGVVNGIAFATRLGGDALRRSEAGQPQAYTSALLAGVVVIAGAILVLGGDALAALGLVE